MIRDQINE